MTTTTKQIERLVKIINDLANELGIYEGAEWREDSPVTGAGTFVERGSIPAHLADSTYRFPHAILQHGSPTYGHAWRLNATGGTRYGTAEYDVFRLGSGYLGSTKNEAYQTLRGIMSGLEIAVSQKVEA